MFDDLAVGQWLVLVAVPEPSSPLDRLLVTLGKTFRTEGVILRGIRLGEADRVLHIYTEQRGRVGAVAKGVRRTSSRFGGRLEPFFRVNLMLHEGRGDLLKVTGAQTVAAHIRLRDSRGALEAATQGCEAVLRLMGSAEPNSAAYNLLCRYLALLEERARRGSKPTTREWESVPTPVATEPTDWRALSVAFRLKLLWAAGFAPHLAFCANCGGGGPLVGFSAAAGGVVCESCGAGAFGVTAGSVDFMRAVLETPLADLVAGSNETLRTADRAVLETLAHHAHVRLRPVVSGAQVDRIAEPASAVA